MFGSNGIVDSNFIYTITNNAVFLVILTVASTPLASKAGNTIREKLNGKEKLYFALEIIWYLTIFVLSVAYLVDSTYNPFIYFRF